MKDIRKDDFVICVTKAWEIVRGHPTLTPKFNEIYSVKDTVPESQYVILKEGDRDAGYDKDGFERLVNESVFNRTVSAILKVPKPKKFKL